MVTTTKTTAEMTNFWNLPRSVRERIYRLDLVHEASLELDVYISMCGKVHTHPPRTMPCLMQVSRRLELEALGIFLGENSFVMSLRDMSIWKYWMPRRHYNQIRSVVVKDWWSFGNMCDESFRMLGSMRSLESLSVRVDEQEALRSYLESTAKLFDIKWHNSLGYGPQVQLNVLRFEGIRGLRSLRGLRHVEFLPVDPEAEEEVPGDFGPIPGGLLDTVIKKEMMASRDHQPFERDGHFHFLDLPAELRTAIYKMLLVNPGVTYPTAGMPTSVICASKQMRKAAKKAIPTPRSALTVLRTNRQIHNEAVRIFYRFNHLVFQYPSHLQAFTLSLEKDRLESIASLVLFYKNHNEGGLHTMEITLRLLHRMRGLKRFHLLLENHMTPKIYGTWRTYLKHGRPAHIRGAAVLFSLRGIEDIKVRDLKLEQRIEQGGEDPQTSSTDKSTVAHQQGVLKHFNYGLRQAVHNERVVKELYEDESWHLRERFPALMEESECGQENGCSCE